MSSYLDLIPPYAHKQIANELYKIIYFKVMDINDDKIIISNEDSLQQEFNKYWLNSCKHKLDSTSFEGYSYSFTFHSMENGIFYFQLWRRYGWKICSLFTGSNYLFDNDNGYLYIDQISREKILEYCLNKITCLICKDAPKYIIHNERFKFDGEYLHIRYGSEDKIIKKICNRYKSIVSNKYMHKTCFDNTVSCYICDIKIFETVNKCENCDKLYCNDCKGVMSKKSCLTSCDDCGEYLYKCNDNNIYSCSTEDELYIYCLNCKLECNICKKTCFEHNSIKCHKVNCNIIICDNCTDEHASKHDCFKLCLKCDEQNYYDCATCDSKQHDLNKIICCDCRNKICDNCKFIGVFDKKSRCKYCVSIIKIDSLCIGNSEIDPKRLKKYVIK